MSATFRWILFGLVMAALMAGAHYFPPDGHERGALLQFFGRFHPVLVHLPIALFLLVPLLEVAGLTGRFPHLRQTAGVILGLATLSALIAAADGWLLARSGGYHGVLVNRHLWGGVMLCVAGLLCCGLRASPRGGPAYAVALIGTVGLMAWTSHQGASLTHGETYLTQYMPGRLRRWFALPPLTTAAATTFYGVRIQPIFDDNCVTCHNPNKRKGDLELESYEALVLGGKHGPVVKPGHPAASELFLRITLPPSDKHFMPTDGKTPLSPEAVKTIELWITAGASATTPVNAIAGVPLPPAPRVALAPDYHARAEQIRTLAAALGVRLLPRSQIATDGLVLRTANDPERCDDAALQRLQPVADLIVDAELARTKVTDAGLPALARWTNLRHLDLSHTAVTGRRLGLLASLKKLESLNLTESQADSASVARLHLPSVPHIYSFDLKGVPAGPP